VVKWLKFVPTILDFRGLWGNAPRREGVMSGTHMYHHATFHYQKVALPPRYLSHTNKTHSRFNIR